MGWGVLAHRGSEAELDDAAMQDFMENCGADELDLRRGAFRAHSAERPLRAR